MEASTSNSQLTIASANADTDRTKETVCSTSAADKLSSHVQPEPEKSAAVVTVPSPKTKFDDEDFHLPFPPIPPEEMARLREEFYTWDYSQKMEPPDLGPEETETTEEDEDDDDEDDIYFDELELPSDSDYPVENQNPVEDPDSSSNSVPDGLGTIGVGVEVPIQELKQNVSDDANLADLEAMQSDADSRSEEFLQPVINKPNSNTQRRCQQCQKTTYSVFQYCLGCFKNRRNWLPKRPRSRRLKRIKRERQHFLSSFQNFNNSSIRDADRSAASCDMQTTVNENLVRSRPSSAEINLNDAFIFSKDNSAFNNLTPESPLGNITLCDLLTPPNSQETKETNTNFQPNLSALISTNLTPSTAIISDDEIASTSDNENDAELCCICCATKKDSAFVHNKIAHYCCCYSCGKKILKRSGKCPVCREKVFRVVRIV